MEIKVKVWNENEQVFYTCDRSGARRWAAVPAREKGWTASGEAISIQFWSYLGDHSPIRRRMLVSRERSCARHCIRCRRKTLSAGEENCGRKPASSGSGRNFRNQ